MRSVRWVPDERTMDFFDHLEELRTRLIRCILYLIPGGVLGWVVKSYVWNLLSVPFYAAVEGLDWKVEPEMITVGPEQALFAAMQIALATGLLIALVPILVEVWRFVEPALEPHEKRYAVVFLPGGVALFVLGMSFAYLVAPVAFRFMLSFTATLDVAAKIDIGRYLGMLLRMLIAFGIVFELPLALKLLGKLGLVSAGGLLSKWRYAIFMIVVVAAVVTPTQDPVNLAILALPLVVLYFLSVFLVYLDERALGRLQRRDRPAAAGAGPDTDAQGAPGPGEPPSAPEASSGEDAGSA
jgi:sec-independent protein translocase protein TatC